MRFRIYIAAPYPQRVKAQQLMRALEEGPFDVTSRWLREDDTLSDEHARKDLADVARAEALILLNEPEWAEKGTGGRHVEFGYALALRREVIVIGPATNMFHHLSDVTQFADCTELLEHRHRVADLLQSRRQAAGNPAEA